MRYKCCYSCILEDIHMVSQACNPPDRCAGLTSELQVSLATSSPPTSYSFLNKSRMFTCRLSGKSCKHCPCHRDATFPGILGIPGLKISPGGAPIEWKKAPGEAFLLTIIRNPEEKMRITLWTKRSITKFQVTCFRPLCLSLSWLS